VVLIMAKSNWSKGDVEQAVNLMNTTAKPLSQIASETGFSAGGEALARKLLDDGLKTPADLSEHRQKVHRANAGKA
jgi:transcriptional regulator GlxA family with amidase domain